MGGGQAKQLLHYVDARVHTSLKSFPARVQGTLAIGVRERGAMLWWIARFGKETTTTFAGSLPRDFDAGIAMDVQTARWVLGIEEERGDFHFKTGDLELLSKFTSMFLQASDLMSVRIRGMR